MYDDRLHIKNLSKGNAQSYILIVIACDLALSQGIDDRIMEYLIQYMSHIVTLIVARK